MLTSIFVLSVITGLFFRSLYAFYLTLFAFLLFIYPIITISILIAVVVYVYLSNKGNNHEQSKLHSSSDRDDEPS
jgi:uncharacterized membrane protein